MKPSPCGMYKLNIKNKLLLLMEVYYARECRTIT